MAAKNQILDMSPLGMIFTVVKYEKYKNPATFWQANK